jgi:hypothetical protein
VPEAATLNVAVCPDVTVWLAGCEVIDGATAAAFTVRVAVLLVALPAEFVTTTENIDPLSAVVAAGVVYELEVAPPMFAPFFRH